MKARNLLAVSATAMSLVLAYPAMAQSTGGAATGAVGGAAAGAVVGGPVGAAVGGVTGAIVGGALAPADTGRVKEYVVREHRPSVKLKEKVVVGEALPSSVELYTVPADVGVKTEYRYTVVNDRAVLVDPHSRKIVQIID
ncbi:DUF1236 domain-containing protein [Alsobacter sp. SYSU M60028]|uniref:DUF1236 domain-containing protein n=1 Tax=Alsobacter ponti TaxID=2962936 RepID=A0ABT1LFR6_9HYPH|nr:DUF1236 domain-containing protein [Alsobacter ponti]MCP8940269.1 DUF1236 domain-containing protein [Alsobacter ponti]